MRAPGAVADGLRIGLLGGSFNPAHEGHIHVSNAALKALDLDYVWWLVSPQNPLKATRGMTSFATRLAKAKHVAHNHPRIVATDIEDDLGTRYTIDTISSLKRRFPNIRFIWLMGSDNLVQIPRWRRWQQIFERVPVAVVARPGSALPARFSKAASRYKAAAHPANPRFPDARPPALTIIETRRHPLSGTALRSGSASRKR